MAALQAWAARRTGRRKSLGRLGSLEVRLAHTAAEVRQAQKLRYRVFYQEGSAIARCPAGCSRAATSMPSTRSAIICWCSTTPARRKVGQRPAVVGTYRLLRQDVAEDHGGFYTAGEFDIGALIARHRKLQFLELGRSCVLAPYRNKRTVELLWHGIWTYVLQNRLDVMIGCASLDGTDPERLALPLSFLHHYRARAGAVARARAAGTLCRDEPDVEGSDRSEGGAARAAAADQGLSAARRLTSATAR